jgi:hypothetical protein
LHGLAIRSRSDLSPDPASLLLGRLRELPEGGPADVEIATRLATSRAELEPGSAPALVHGMVRIHEPPQGEGAGLLRVAVPGALVHVHERGRLEGILGAAGPDQLHAFALVALHAALLAALRPRGLYHLHAAALVAPDGRSLIVAGEAGAGKSTLAAALVTAGFDYLGDDTVLVALREGAPRLLALPRDFHLAERSAAAIPGAALLLEGFTLGGKRGLDPRRAFPGRARDETGPPAAILLPRVAGTSSTVLRPASPAEALGTLVEQSAYVAVRSLPGAREHLRLLGMLADRAGAWRVDLGTDLLSDAAGTAARVAREVLR